MNDFSLHILDLVENSIRAGASVVTVTVAEDAPADRLEIGVEDNGRGLPVPAERAANPFYTTKRGKKTGLGLSLFREAVEAAGGQMEIADRPGGGVRVWGTMRARHIDRKPLGDMAASLWSMVCTNPGIDFGLRVRQAGSEFFVSAGGIRRELGAAAGDPLTVAGRFAEQARESLGRLGAWKTDFDAVRKETGDGKE